MSEERRAKRSVVGRVACAAAACAAAACAIACSVTGEDLNPIGIGPNEAADDGGDDSGEEVRATSGDALATNGGDDARAASADGDIDGATPTSPSDGEGSTPTALEGSTKPDALDGDPPDDGDADDDETAPPPDDLSLPDAGGPDGVSPLDDVDAGASGPPAIDPSADAGALPAEPAEALPDAAAPGEENDAPVQESVVGWASMPGLGLETTSGGAGGPTVIVTTGTQLQTFAQSEGPLVIAIEGTLRAGRVQVASDKTLIGLGADATLEGALRIRGTAGAFVHNVIVQNLRVDAAFSEVDGDGVQVHYAHHVWLDHCEIDGALDDDLSVVHGSDFVTVSWTRFDRGFGSGKAVLIGHSDAAAAAFEDAGHLRVTFHHDLWAAGITSNMPRARFGDVHLFNNLFEGRGIDASVRASLGSRVLVEDNFFDRVPLPHRVDADAAPTAELRAVGNLYRGPESLPQTAGSAFEPPYDYALDDATSVRALVREGAGRRAELGTLDD